MQLTRRELYDRVWARPMTKVATEFGISDVGLHKICMKHRIPVPGRGYWAKVRAGHQPMKALFREITDPALNRVVVTGAPYRNLPAPVTEARNKVVAAVKVAPSPVPPVASPQARPNVLLEPSRAAAKKARPGADGFIRLGGPKVVQAVIAPASVERMIGILDRLITAVDARGWKFVVGQSGAPHLLVEGEVITLGLSEKVDRVPHKPTERELTALRRWEVKRERERRLGQRLSDWDKPAIPEFELVPNGLLVLE